jgi:hypothetical protein
VAVRRQAGVLRDELKEDPVDETFQPKPLSNIILKQNVVDC